jgi:hypothetical protein
MQRRIDDLRQRVTAEEARVAELRRHGQPTDDVSRLLHEIKQTLRLMEAHRTAGLLPPRQ